jgi:hypothetical protein
MHSVAMPVSTPSTYDHFNDLIAFGLSKHRANHSPLASRLLVVMQQRAEIEHENALEHFVQENLAIVGRDVIASFGMAQDSKRPHELHFCGSTTPRGLATGCAQRYS